MHGISCCLINHAWYIMFQHETSYLIIYSKMTSTNFRLKKENHLKYIRNECENTIRRFIDAFFRIFEFSNMFKSLVYMTETKFAYGKLCFCHETVN